MPYWFYHLELRRGSLVPRLFKTMGYSI